MTAISDTFGVYCAGEQIADGLGITYIYVATPLGPVRMTAEEADQLGRLLIAAAEYDRDLNTEEDR